MGDLTIIYYSANKISKEFFEKTKNLLLEAAGDIPIISVTHKPIDLGTNICVGDIGQSDFNIYRQLLIGAKKAKTKYIATAEDDTLYHKSHFDIRPSSDDIFAYNMNKWSIFTWSRPPIFSNRGRRTLNALICDRLLLIEALEERFFKYKRNEDIPYKYWGEPGRYEKLLGVTVRKSEKIESEIPIIMFSHPDSLNYKKQGIRKRLGIDRAESLPFWGEAKDIVSYFSKRNDTNYIVTAPHEIAKTNKENKNDMTILYYSSNRENEKFERNIIENIKQVKGDLPVVSVTQKPLDFGTNICVGEKEPCVSNIFMQVLTGLRAIKTKYVISAESDFLYPPEYFNFVPPDDEHVYRYVPVYVIWHKDKNKYTKFYEKPFSEGAQACNRLYWIQQLEKVVDESKNWKPHKVYPVFNTGIEYTWSSDNPAVTFKTYNGVHRKTQLYRGKGGIVTLPYWGHYKKIGEKYEVE